MMNQRTYLSVPFAEKDAAKKLGARWDMIARAWYVPDGIASDSFMRWLPSQQSLLAPLLQSGEETISEKGISLSALMLKAHESVVATFTNRVWVKAEITELNQRSGHFYLTLAESVSGQQVAQARATLWASQAPRLLAQFESVTGQGLQVGCAVLLAVEVGIHARFGLSLTIMDIDPSFTLGDQQAKLQAIRAELQKKGIYTRNKQRIVAKDLQRIAVLSPAQAAGLGDFQADAQLLTANHLCQFAYFYASFQGQQTQQEMLAALKNIEQAHQKTPFDVLVIIRGGGAKQDLMFLNNFELAKRVCLFPIAVLTGIGHERDDTILDEVAHRRFDTPSKVIAYIRDQIVQSTQQAKASWQRIVQLSQLALLAQKEAITAHRYALQKQAQQMLWTQRQMTQQLQTQLAQAAHRRCLSQTERVNYAYRQVEWVAHYQLHQARLGLTQLQASIFPNAQAKIGKAHQQLTHYQTLVASHHPKRLLSLGYLIVRDDQGKLITSRSQALAQARLTLEFKDGTMHVIPEPNQEETAL